MGKKRSHSNYLPVLIEDGTFYNQVDAIRKANPSIDSYNHVVFKGEEDTYPKYYYAIIGKNGRGELIGFSSEKWELFLSADNMETIVGYYMEYFHPDEVTFMRENPAISAFDVITTDDYTWLFGDFDGDGILNIDDPKPFEKGSKETFEEVKLSDEIKALIELRNKFTGVLNKVMADLRKLAPKGKVKGRVKSPLSTINKLRRKRIVGKAKTAKEGEQYTQGLTDMAGCMLIVDSFAELSKVIATIKKGKLGKVFEHEDFYANPNNGYRAHHFILDVDGYFVEVQIKTARLALISAAAHTPYKEGKLNAAEMLRLTDLAVLADKGDSQAQSELDGLIQDEATLEKALTTRQNPEVLEMEAATETIEEQSSEPQTSYEERLLRIQTKYRKLIGLINNAAATGKITDAKLQQAIPVLEQIGELIGLDYYEVSKSNEETQSTDTNTVLDLDLTKYAPIVMSKPERRKANEAAVKVLSKDDAEITQSDREKLRLYTGAGGVGYATDDVKRGLLNEHYTSYDVVKYVWEIVTQKLGLNSGTFLEPGSGIGNFAGFIPNKNVRMVMVERSSISARIAKLLYPQQIVVNQNYATFENFKYAFSGAVGNVPFGNFSITGQTDKFYHLHPSIHDYFILKALDLVQVGGIVALITSTSTADKKNTAIREEMVKMADLVSAIRLPSEAFKGNASTDVTTDLLIFQKKPADKAQERNALSEQFAYGSLIVETMEYKKDGKTESQNAFYNPIYKTHPENILGEMIQGHAVQFFSRMGVKGKVNAATLKTFKPHFEKLRYDLPKNRGLLNENVKGEDLVLSRDYPPNALILHEKKFYEKAHHVFQPVSVPKSIAPKIASAVTLLDTYYDFVKALSTNAATKEALRTQFRAETDKHIEAYGFFNEDKDLEKVLRYDPRYYKLTAFVKKNPETGNVIYADIYDTQSMYSKAYVPQLDNSENLDQIASFLHANGEEITIDNIQTFYQGGTATKEDVLAALKKSESFYHNPLSDRYEFKYEYLGGNVRTKYNAVKDLDTHKREAAALQKVMPATVSVFDIAISPTHIHGYLPTHIVEKFFQYYTGLRLNLSVAKHAQYGADSIKAMVTTQYRDRWDNRNYKFGEDSRDKELGWDTLPFSKIFDLFIKENNFPWIAVDKDGNLNPNMKRDTLIEKNDSEGIRRSDERQKQNTNRMRAKIVAEFRAYVHNTASVEVQNEIEEAYNLTYNNFGATQFDGSTISVRGMSNTFYGVKDFTIYKHNKMVAEKLAWNGSGANCHDVGAGKTLATILLLSMLKQRGVMLKPMMVVPGKVQQKWVEEHLQLFPDAKILSLDLSSSTRKKELALAQLYDWDAIYISENAFARFPLSPKEEAKMLERRIAYFDEMIEEYVSEMDDDDKGADRLRKRMEKLREQIEVRITDLTKKATDNTDVFFDEIGVDGLIFDEAHNYKNALGSAKAYELGIGANKPSKRSEDALQKTTFINEKVGNKNVFVLTATPVVNSPIEVWHMLNLCSPHILAKYDIGNLDNFIRMFVYEETKMVKNTAGEFVSRSVVGGYANLPEMQRIIDEVMDIKSYDQLIQWYEDNPETIMVNGKPKVIKPKFKRPSAVTKHELIEPSEIHTLLFEDLTLRAEDVLDDMKSGDIPADNFLSITGDGGTLSTDLRLYDTQFADFDHDSLKIKKVVENIVKTYKGAEELRSNPGPEYTPDDIYGDFFSKDAPIRQNPTIANQIIFCERTNLKNGDSFHQLIKKSIAAKGIPADQIAIINGKIIGTQKDGKDYFVKGTDDKLALKKQVQDDFNDGKYRVLIGNQSIAEGMNLQTWTVAQHHMDVPYTPSALQQRNGRGVRQGNQYSSVDVYYYLLKDSFDSNRLELVVKKQNWIDQLFSSRGKREASNDDEGSAMSFEEMQSAIASDPRVKEYFTIKQRIRDLNTSTSQLRSEYERNASAVLRKREEMEHRLSNYENGKEREAKLTAPKGEPTITFDRYVYDGNEKRYRFIINADGITQEKRRFHLFLEIEKGVSDSRIARINYVRIAPINDYGQRTADDLRTLYNGQMYTYIARYLAAFPESGISEIGDNYAIANLDDVIAASGKTEEELRTVPGVKTKRRWEDIKISLLKSDSIYTWVPIIQERLKPLILFCEQQWYDNRNKRLEVQKSHYEAAKSEHEIFEKRAKETSEEFAAGQLEYEKAIERERELIEIVQQLTTKQFETRSALYDRLNDIAPKYGIKDRIKMKVVEAKPKKEKAMRSNPEVTVTMVKLGMATQLETTTHKMEGDGSDVMIANTDFSTIYIVPGELIQSERVSVSDSDAENRFAEFNRYKSKSTDLSFEMPSSQKQSLGFAKNVIYKSDKIMQNGDKVGKYNAYIHDFDENQRPVFMHENGVIEIQKVKINHRGILN